MPILQLNTDQSAKQYFVLATGLGIVFGMLIGIPPALAVISLGLSWVPYGVAVLIAGLVVGLLLFLSPDAPEDSVTPPSASRARLAGEKAYLDHLDEERARQGNSGFGMTAEESIVWGELLELELQDIDEQMSRLCEWESALRG